MTGAQPRLTVVPLTLADAREVVRRLHRHHRPPTGHRFSLGVLAGDRLVGAAIIGRPVARALDQQYTAEVTRVATDGTPNACSALYGAAWRTARAAGYLRLITYTQDGESGASLRGAGWRQVAVLRPRAGWDTPARRREDHGTDGVARILWERAAADAPVLPPLADLRDGFRDGFRCGVCGGLVRLPRRGPVPSHCSPACRQRAYRDRCKAVTA